MQTLNELLKEHEEEMFLVKLKDIIKMKESKLFSREFIKELKSEAFSYNTLYEGNVSDAPFTLISVDEYNFKTADQLQFCLDSGFDLM